MTALSVNVNKFALVRNARGADLPNLIDISNKCLNFGADGITVHPRPDERHAKFSDLDPLKNLLSKWWVTWNVLYWSIIRSYRKINCRWNIISFMTNSDYLLKAAIKKVTEKLNEILVEKIEEATNIAQDAPEILKKEFDILKESIIEEASRMEKAENIQENESTNTYQDTKIKKALNEIEVINKQIDLLNKNINNI